jgi:hypothetical protein
LPDGGFVGVFDDPLEEPGFGDELDEPELDGVVDVEEDPELEVPDVGLVVEVVVLAPATRFPSPSPSPSVPAVTAPAMASFRSRGVMSNLRFERGPFPRLIMRTRPVLNSLVATSAVGQHSVEVRRRT